MPTPYKPDSEVVKEFYKKFAYNDGGPDWKDPDGIKLLRPSDIAPFLLSTRHADREALLDEVEEWGEKHSEWVQGFVGGADEVIHLSDLNAFISQLRKKV